MPATIPCTDIQALCWIEAHPGLAGYVQAVGAIAAIIISVQLARSSAKRERQADEAATRRMVEADQAQRDRDAAANRAADLRIERAKIEEHNAIIQRVTSWGLLATDECQSEVISARQFFSENTATVQGGFSSRRLAELRERLSRLDDDIGDIELLEAIGALRDSVHPHEIKGTTGPNYIAALEGELSRIFDALGEIEALRRPLPTI